MGRSYVKSLRKQKNIVSLKDLYNEVPVYLTETKTNDIPQT